MSPVSMKSAPNCRDLGIGGASNRISGYCKRTSMDSVNSSWFMFLNGSMQSVCGAEAMQCFRSSSRLALTESMDITLSSRIPGCCVVIYN
jgi:hypothetical protein